MQQSTGPKIDHIDFEVESPQVANTDSQEKMQQRHSRILHQGFCVQRLFRNHSGTPATFAVPAEGVFDPPRAGNPSGSGQGGLFVAGADGAMLKTVELQTSGKTGQIPAVIAQDGDIRITSRTLGVTGSAPLK